MSTPISAMMSCAQIRPTPLISSNCCTWCSSGVISCSIRAVSWSIWAESASMVDSIIEQIARGAR